MAERFDEQQLAVARVYAQSLLALARKNGEEELVAEEFDAMLEQFDRQPAFERLLSDPAIDEAERESILERVLRNRANDLVVNTLQVMNRKGRAGLLRPLVEAYRRELEELQNIVEAHATTAVELTDDSRERLAAVLGRLTGKTVLLKESIDETLIGGLVLRVGDQKFDTSVARELWRVAERLEERGSEELHASSMMER